MTWDTGRSIDCVTGACASAVGVWIGAHWVALLGGSLLVWRTVQAILEMLGFDVQPGWLIRLLRRCRDG